MPVGKETNARSQPAKGRPSEQRRCQVAHRQPEEAPQGSPSQASSRHGITLPRVPYPERFRPVATQQAQMGSLGHRVVLPSTSGLRQEQTLHLSPFITMAPWEPPRSERAVGSCCRVPLVTPAASAASGSVRNSAVGSASSNQQQLLKTAAQLHHVPSYGSRDAWPETCQPALHRSKASAPTSESSGSMSTVLQSCSTGSQGRCQKPAAWQEPAHSKLLGLHQKVFPQRLPPLPHIKTSEQPKRSCLPRAPEKHWTPLPPIAPAQGSHHSGRQEAAAQGQRQAPAPQTTRAMDAALQATAMSEERKALLQSVAVIERTNQQQVERQEEPAAFPEEEDEEAKEDLEYVSDKELSQGEAVTMHSICVSPLVPELFQDPQADIHLESSIRSNVGTNATSEAAGDLQSVSPVLAGATDTELAAPRLPGAAEEEQHRAPLTSVEQEQEEAPAPPSHGFDEEEAEAEARRKPFARLSRTSIELIRLERARKFMRGVLRKPLPVIYETDEEPLEQEDIDKNHVGVPMAATMPAAVEDTESPAAAELQAEPSTAHLVPAAGEAAEDMVSTMSREHQEEFVKVDVCPAVEEGKHRAALAAVVEERKAPAQASCAFSEQEEEEEARRKVPSLLGPVASELVPQEVTSHFARNIIHRNFAMIKETIQQRVEEQDVAEAVDVSMAARRPAEIQHIKSPVPTPAQAQRKAPTQGRSRGTDRQGQGQAFTQGPVPPQVQSQAPQRLSVVDSALQVVFRRKVRKAAEEHQGEASRTFASPRFYRDEQAVPAAAQDTEEEPTTSLIPAARRPGWWRRLRQSESARASPTWETIESQQGKTPLKMQKWQLQSRRNLLPVDTHATSYTWGTANPNEGLHDNRDKHIREQQLSRFRMALKALRRAFRRS